jgi:CRP-like cAMP-binding protein
MMKGLSFRLLGFIRNMERQSSHNAMHRVIDYLLQTAQAQDTTDIRLELKKNVVASILHLTPETFSRMLQQLMEEGLITVKASRISIFSISALQEFLHFYNEQEMACGKASRSHHRDSGLSASTH